MVVLSRNPEVGSRALARDLTTGGGGGGRRRHRLTNINNSLTCTLDLPVDLDLRVNVC